MQPAAKSLEQARLRHVAQRIAIRIRSDVKPKADSRGGPEPLFDAHIANLATFDPTELTARHPNRLASRILAHPGVVSSESDLVRDLMVDATELLKRPVQPTIASRHASNSGREHSLVD